MPAQDERVLSVPQVPWDEFKATFRWRQGEHVTAIAPTGAGKTMLMSQLMGFRRYNIFFGTKPDDDSYRRILRQGYQRIESISEVRPTHDKYMLWPAQRKTIPATLRAQRAAFEEAMDTVVQQRAWTVWFDEAKYMVEMLKLKTQLTYCLEQLRSIKATVICGSQRPVYLPLSAISSATHLFLWKSTLDKDRGRLADIGGVDLQTLGELLRTLDEHEFVYVKTRGTVATMKRSEVKL